MKPDEISQNRCSSASQVEVGRCDSTIDDKLCTVNKSACQIAPKHSKDGTCNVVHDSSSDGMTRYPYCRTLPAFDADQPFRCVLSEEDCTERELAIQLTTFANEDPCYCHQVPTGMCYLTATASAQITTDSSFCAVDAYDCPDAYAFLSATQLLTMESPPRYCRLCERGQNNTSIEQPQYHEQIVEAGGCVASNNPGLLLRCALEYTDCQLSNKESFKSAPQLRAMGIIPCPVDEMQVGRCTSSLDDGDCTNRADSCLIPIKFAVEDSCTVHKDVITGMPTTFGHCQNSEDIRNEIWDNYRCVWQEAECDIPMELWYPASGIKNWFQGCSCEEVVTGGCVYDGEVHCAVSELGCADSSTYRNAKELEADGTVCHLCHPKVRNKAIDMVVDYNIMNNDNNNNNNNNNDTDSILKSDDSIDNKDLLNNNNDNSNNNKNNIMPDQSTKSTGNENLGAIIGGSLGGMFVLTALVTLIYMRNKKRKA